MTSVRVSSSRTHPWIGTVTRWRATASHCANACWYAAVLGPRSKRRGGGRYTSAARQSSAVVVPLESETLRFIGSGKPGRPPRPSSPGVGGPQPRSVNAASGLSRPSRSSRGHVAGGQQSGCRRRAWMRHRRFKFATPSLPSALLTESAPPIAVCASLLMLLLASYFPRKKSLPRPHARGQRCESRQ